MLELGLGGGGASKKAAPIPVQPFKGTPASSFGMANQYYQGLYGPKQTLYGNQIGNIMADVGLQGASNQWQRGTMNQQYGLDAAGLANQQAGQGIDTAAIQRQQALLDQLAGLDTGQYEALKGFLGQGRGIDVKERDLAEKLAYEGHQAGLRGFLSGQTARGAVATAGTERSMSEMEKQLAGQMEKIGLGDQASQLGYDKAMSGLEADRAKGLLTGAEQKAKLGDQKAALDLQAKDYGLKGDELKLALERGLGKLQLDTLMSVNDLMDMVMSKQIDMATLGEQIIREAMATRDQFPTPGVSSGVPRSGAAGPVTPGQSYVNPWPSMSSSVRGM